MKLSSNYNDISGYLISIFRLFQNSILVTSPGPILAADQDSGINAPLFYTTSGDNKHLLNINKDSGQVIVTDQLLAIAQPVTIVIKVSFKMSCLFCKTLIIVPRCAPIIIKRSVFRGRKD